MPHGSSLGFFPGQFKTSKIQSSKPRGLHFHHKLFTKLPTSLRPGVPPNTDKAWWGGHHQPFLTIITLQSEQHWRRAWELTIATAVGPGLSHSPLSSCHWALAPRSGQMCAYNAPPSSEDHLQVHTHSARPRTDNQCLCHPATCTPPPAGFQLPLSQKRNVFYSKDFQFPIARLN